jgi:SnoaL-like domain
MLSHHKAQPAAARFSPGLRVGAFAGRKKKHRDDRRDAWRPTIDIEQVRASWNRADQLFTAIACQDAAAIQNAYADNAELRHAIVGSLSGPDIKTAWRRFLARTPDLTLSFQICHAGVATAEIVWTLQHRFFENNRPIVIDGTTLLRFSEGRIAFQRDSFSRRDWFRQALGLKGLILSFIPGWSKFLEFEVRRSLDLVETER